MPSTGVEASARGRRASLRSLGVALATVVVLALLVELGFRLGTSQPWYARLEVEQDEEVPEKKIDGRPFGIRAALEMPPKEAGTLRILFLGDSFTFGSGVEDVRRVFPSVVTELLDGAGGPRVEHFNGGIPGSLTHRWVELLEAAGDSFQPDLVVAVFFLRDGTRFIGGSRGHIRRIGAQMAELSDSSWLFRTSRAYRYFRERSAQREFSREYLELMRRAYFGDERETFEWKRAQANLLTLRSESERRGARFALVLFPVLFELDEGYPLADVCAEVDRFAAEHGLTYLSLLPTFLGQDAPSLWVSALDQHPNERGHALAAGAIAEFLAPLVGAR
jgi:hypothetical protein